MNLTEQKRASWLLFDWAVTAGTRSKLAYSLNCASLSLPKARAFTREQFDAAGVDMDKVFPNFDRNYLLLQRKCRSAHDIPRNQMPKVKQEQMQQFAADLTSGRLTGEIVKCHFTGMAAGNVIPTQSQIWLELLVNSVIKYGPPVPGSPALTATVIVSREKYILDGHHRFGQAILRDPSLRLSVLSVPMPLGELLGITRDYGDKLGNPRGASVL